MLACVWASCSRGWHGAVYFIFDRLHIFNLNWSKTTPMRSVWNIESSWHELMSYCPHSEILQSSENQIRRLYIISGSSRNNQNWRAWRAHQCTGVRWTFDSSAFWYLSVMYSEIWWADMGRVTWENLQRTFYTVIGNDLPSFLWPLAQTATLFLIIVCTASTAPESISFDKNWEPTSAKNDVNHRSLFIFQIALWFIRSFHGRTGRGEPRGSDCSGLMPSMNWSRNSWACPIPRHVGLLLQIHQQKWRARMKQATTLYRECLRSCPKRAWAALCA